MCISHTHSSRLVGIRFERFYLSYLILPFAGFSVIFGEFASAFSVLFFTSLLESSKFGVWFLEV